MDDMFNARTVAPCTMRQTPKPDTQRSRSVHARLCQCYLLGNHPARSPKKVSEAGFKKFSVETRFQVLYSRK